MNKKEIRKLIDDARAKGDKKYFTGRPCKHGHVAERYVDSQTCCECIRIANNREEVLSVTRDQKYGLDAGEYEARLDEQNGCCAICRQPIEKTPHVDHCHTTGEVRGLLCRHCNWGLGHFKDNIDYLKNAIAYLNVYQ